MKKSLIFIKNKIALLSAITLATIVGGATTAIVLAAIPDSNGVIHACYSGGNSGRVRIIDNSTANCNTNETAITWNQTGPQGPAGASGSNLVLKDANGQVLGDLTELGHDYNSADRGIKVFNHTLNRIINFQSFGSEVRVGMPAAPSSSGGVTAEYESSDCTGQPYANTGVQFTPKLMLFRVVTQGSFFGYFIVSDNATTASITVGSIANTNGECNVGSGTPEDAYPLTQVSLPFSTPVATPFKF